MPANGVEVFDRTLQTTHVWLDEIMAELGPDRQVAWRALSAVLRTLRDRLPIELAAHLGAQLPLLVRGAYYDQWHPAGQPDRTRDLDGFLARVDQKLDGIRPINVRDATRAVLRVLSRHLDRGQVLKAVGTLPRPIREFWPLEGTTPSSGDGATEGRSRRSMKVKDKMTRDVRLAHPDETIRDVARTMGEIDAGVLPVADGDRLIGMITDRDIAIRAIAQGKGPDTQVREVMTPEVMYCFEDEDIERVAHNMGDIQVHRLPVVTRDKRLVGIISLADIAMGEGPHPAGEALAGISRPGGLHSQIGGPRLELGA